MAQEEIGIIINVKDKASQGIRAIGTVARASATAVKTLGTVGVGAMRAIGGSVVVLNQGVELLKKGFELAKLAMEQTVVKALEFRKASDPMVVFFKNFNREVETSKARLGDALLPVFRGFIEAVQHVTGDISNFIAENRKLIGLNMVSFFKTIGLALVNGIGGAVQFVIEKWGAWQGIIGTVKQVLAAAFGTILESINMVIGGISKVASFFNMDVSGLESVRSTINGWTESLAETAFQAEATAATNERAASSLAAKIQSMRDFSVSVIEDATQRSTALIEQSRVGMDITREEYEAQAAAITETDNQMTEAIKANRDALAAKEGELGEARRRLAEENKQAIQTGIDMVGGPLTDTLTDVIMGTAEAGEAFKAMGKQIVQSIISSSLKGIVAKAAEAAAGAASSQAAIPIVGPALAAGAMVAMFAAVSGMKSKVKAAGGGEIQGGIMGRDSVPALLMPGERVLTVGENKQLKNLMKSISGSRPGGNGAGPVAQFADGGEVNPPIPARGSNVTLNFAPNIQSMEIPDSEQRRRTLISLSNDLEELINDRVILPGLAAV